jgi:hypothetical protein
MPSADPLITIQIKSRVAVKSAPSDFISSTLFGVPVTITPKLGAKQVPPKKFQVWLDHSLQTKSSGTNRPIFRYPSTFTLLCIQDYLTLLLNLKSLA